MIIIGDDYDLAVSEFVLVIIFRGQEEEEKPRATEKEGQLHIMMIMMTVIMKMIT